MPESRILGTGHNDVLSGDDGDNYFGLWQGSGGEDNVSGRGGNDIINFGTTFDPGDIVDGGAGADILLLDGAYGDIFGKTITLGANTLTSVETIQVGAGHDYFFISNDANVAAGASLTFNAVALGPSNWAVFDGAAETDGNFLFVGGAGTNQFTGGAGNDHFIYRHGGVDFGSGGGGNDVFVLAGNYDLSLIIGGAGNDALILDGPGFSNSLTFAGTLSGVEHIKFADISSYDLTTFDSTVAAGASLVVNAGNLTGAHDLTFNGGKETDGHFYVIGGQGDDVIAGGALHDTIDVSSGSLGGTDTVTGGGGKDLIIASAGNDHYIFNYLAASNSTSVNFDTIRNADFQVDSFVVPWGTMGLPGEIDTGALSKASFDGDLAAAFNGILNSHQAIVFTPNSGGLAGHSFLVIDVNGTVGYQAGQDIVIDVDGYTGLGT